MSLVSFFIHTGQRFLAKIRGNNPSHPVIQAKQYRLADDGFSHSALTVVNKLQRAGFEAYIVGGSVRDVLLGFHPKDFDVATNAHPDQVRMVFKNSRVIGRRFRLVHVYFSEEIIEVATFRRGVVISNDEEDDESETMAAHEQTDTGLIVRDNEYGQLIEDVWRRDFTMNALYYNPKDQTITDYTEGVPDVQHKVLRMIGNPLQRYREDPVRLLRAVRLASKLDLHIHADTQEPIRTLATLLHQVPPARLLEEVIKLFLSGHGLKTYRQLKHHHLFAALFPETHRWCEDDKTGYYEKFIELSLKNTDERVAQNKTVAPGFLFSVMLWPMYEQKLQYFLAKGNKFLEANNLSIDETLKVQSKYIAVPRRLVEVLRGTWELQPRLNERLRKQIYWILESPRFRSAYDFLILRGLAGHKNSHTAAQWWETFLDANDTEREQMLKLCKERSGRKKKRKEND